MIRALLIALGMAAALAAAASPVSYRNPVVSGFNPDPSICRVGKDYYLATSSFEYFPGVPIYHSRDLVHWRQIGHALTRESQLPLKGQRASRGIFAPTLRCHEGNFYLITTNIENGGNFYVHTKDPAGEWSEPVWLKESVFGMDPSLLFDDDGKVYYTRHGGGEHGGVYQAEIDMKTGKLASEARLVWPGTGGVWPEGPHLYKIGGWYYLMISEGGTSYDHSITIARSRSPWGPFDAFSGNPILTHRGYPELPLQATGHGDLVQAENGKWWMVLLGIRPQQRNHHLGRETLLAPVEWTAEGWPVVNGGKAIGTTMTVDGLPAPHPWPAEPVRTQFNTGKLAPHWTHLRTAARDKWSLSERPGFLRLKGSAETLADVASPAFVARRQQHLHMRAAAQVEFSPSGERQAAGLVLRQNEDNHYALRITGVAHRRVELVQRVKGRTSVVASAPLPVGAARLQIESFPDRYEFSYAMAEGAMKKLGEAPAAPLSSENAGGFTGVFVGMYADGENNMAPADFAWFDYEALGD
ncbi:glycoside hydrolase family 43 protein [Massilia endophytica]|uniref:glycoside hydrolase family 43 protein n=1 Tax=Massilia endophytica TaxID=2899220 RepID=UPI001E3E2210|nr:glycoside hydrolase family 43 protein [Massilia endophytica]UGQ47588.1 glycoside hydrolase family 43 protein [Massilia endophytica]